MLIRECLKQKDVTLSFEVFPPKPGMPFQPVQEAVTALSQYTPDFMSVTYGAGGGTSQNTIDIASFYSKGVRHGGARALELRFFVQGGGCPAN